MSTCVAFVAAAGTVELGDVPLEDVPLVSVFLISFIFFNPTPPTTAACAYPIGVPPYCASVLVIA